MAIGLTSAVTNVVIATTGYDGYLTQAKSSAGTTTYTCPAGKKWWVVVANACKSTATAYIQCNISGAAAQLTTDSTTAGNVSSWTGVVVLAAGDSVEIHDQGSFTYREVTA